jgi:hypothetical protein
MRQDRAVAWAKEANVNVRTPMIIALVLSVIGLSISSCTVEPGVGSTVDAAARSYLQDSTTFPFSFSSDSATQVLSSRFGLKTIVLVPADVIFPLQRKPEKGEAIVWLEKRGDLWKVTESTGFRSVNRVLTGKLGNVEVVEIADSSQELSGDLCNGKNIRPASPPTITGRLQVCIEFSASEVEILSYRFLKDLKSVDTGFLVIPAFHDTYIMALGFKDKGRYQLELTWHPSTTPTATYAFDYVP